MGFTAGPYNVTLGGGALLAGARAVTTVTVPGAVAGMQVLMTAQSDIGAGVLYGAWVSSANTVTAWVTGIVALTPASTVYSISVIG